MYKLAGGLSNCQAISEGKPLKYLGNFKNAFYKHRYEERKGETFEPHREHLHKEETVSAGARRQQRTSGGADIRTVLAD